MNAVTWGYGRADVVGMVPAFGYGILVVLRGVPDLVAFTLTVVQRRVFGLER